MEQLQVEDRDLATAEEVFSRLAEFPGADVVAPARPRKGGPPRSQRALVIDLLAQGDRSAFALVSGEVAPLQIQTVKIR